MSSGSGRHEAATTGAVAIVREFLEATVATPDGFWNAFPSYFSEGTIWENVGVARTVGPKEATAFAKAFPVKFHHMIIEDLVLSGEGNRVHAERTDHFCKADGAIVLTVRALGVFEIEDGKIARWRDYFDTAGFLAAIAQPAG